jgi:TatD DNase family protein
MLLVDVHAHMDFPEFKADLPQVLARARAAGMAAIVSQGVHHESNKLVLELAKKYPLLKSALGLYPLNAKNVKVHEEYSDDFDRSSSKSVEETLAFIKQHSQEIVAIGEVGLDFKNSDDEEHQVNNFINILRLSREIKKPLVIHSRKAEKHVLDILEEAKHTHAVLHCFSGSRKLIKRAADSGLMLTVTSNANRLEHFQMLAREVPITQLLTETDAPYLSPVAGERNEPQNVKHAIEAIAKQKALTQEETARSVYMNYQKMFL